MSGTVRVVICDDDEVRARDDWAARIDDLADAGPRLEVQALSAHELAVSLATLEERSVAARDGAGSKSQTEPSTDTPIDGADILIIDYDLTPDPNNTLSMDAETEKLVRRELRAATAETMAYLSRCYSSCKYIVAVNQLFRERTFDLTYGKFIDSRADLNITQDDIDSPELWFGRGEGFRPWTWPRLVEAGNLFTQRVEKVNLDAPVLDCLGLLPIDESGLDARQLDPLGDRPEEITFSEIANLPELGLAGRDQQNDEMALKRIAAAAIGRWLDRLVIPAQNVLVDIPHLIYRFPSLLPGDPRQLESWNAAIDLPEDGLKQDQVSLAEHRIAACEWFARPTWALSKLINDTAIVEVSSPWTAASFDWVFCEDVSRFTDIADAIEVQTDLPGPYSRRFIARVSSANYNPRGRLIPVAD
jgi:hypothetical protein